MEIKKEELSTLFIALYAAKFPLNEDKLSEIAGSSIIVDIMERIMSELGIEYEFYIEDSPESSNYIKKIINESVRFDSLDDEIKREFVEHLLYPFKYSQEALSAFINGNYKNVEERINELIVSDEEKNILSKMYYFKSFIKESVHLKGENEIKLSAGIKLDTIEIYGLQKLLINLEKNDDNQMVIVNVFLSKENNTGPCVVFTDTDYKTCYGLVKALQ